MKREQRLPRKGSPKLAAPVEQKPTEPPPVIPEAYASLPQTPVVLGASASRNPLSQSADSYPVYYDRAIADRITDRYMEGESLHKISKEPGMPCYGTIVRWAKHHPEFSTMLDSARVMRAIHMEEEALEAADSPQDKDDVPAARLKYDSRIWAAGVNHPDRYGKKTTVSGDASRPLTFVITTSVPPSLQEVEASQTQRAVIETVSKVVEEEEALSMGDEP